MLIFQVRAGDTSERSVSYTYFQRLNDAQTGNNKDSITLELKSNSSKNYMFFKNAWHFEGRFKNTKTYLYSIPYAYFFGKFKRTSLYFGRKKLNWNQDEEFWYMNHINSKQGFDLLSERQNGLVGAFTDNKFGRVKVSTFLSPFYIPELYPDYNFNDGKIETNPSWAKKPPPKTIVMDQEKDIYYELDRPRYKDVVIQPSAGLMVAYENSIKGQTSIYALYKPENILKLYGHAYGDPDKESMSVVIKAFVQHHLVAGIRHEQEIAKNYKLSSGLQINRPQRLSKQKIEEEYYFLKSTYRRQDYLFANFKWRKDIINFELKYTQYLNNDKTDLRDVFPTPIMWKQAFGITISYDILDNLFWNTTYQFDIKKRDNIFKNEITYNFKRSFTAGIGLEVLYAPQQDSIWNYYTSQDRLVSNIQYHF